jgi:hypothetical protein
MNLLDEIQFNSGVEINEEEKIISSLQEDFCYLGVNEAIDLYGSLFLVDTEILNEAGLFNSPSEKKYSHSATGESGMDRGEAILRAKKLGIDFSGKSLNQLEAEINNKTEALIKGTSKYGNSISDNLKRASEIAPPRSPAIIASSIPEINKTALETAAEKFKPSIALEDIPKEKQVEFIDAIKNAAKTDDIKAMASAAKKIAPANIATAAVAAKAIPKAQIAPTSMLGQIWSGIKKFFKGGWEGITKAFKTGNYSSLLQIPLVQIGLTIGGTALAFKIIKSIRNKMVNPQPKRV